MRDGSRAWTEQAKASGQQIGQGSTWDVAQPVAVPGVESIDNQLHDKHSRCNRAALAQPSSFCEVALDQCGTRGMSEAQERDHVVIQHTGSDGSSPM